MNRSAIIFSTFVAIIIISILIISTVAMVLCYWGDVDAFKDSMNLTLGIFGGLTTLGAALIAAYLFNDWRDQHNKQVHNNLALQIFNAFSVFEKNLREFSLHLSHLESLRSDYNSHELTWDLVNRHGHMVYITNIASKKDEMDLNFYALLDQLRIYYVFSKDLKRYKESYSRYYNKFIDINGSPLPIHTLIDQIVDYNVKNIGYTDLKNMIDSLEIKKIITNLNA